MIGRILRGTTIGRQNVSRFHTSSFALAGHSKWANIRHDKAKNDAKKSKEAYAMAKSIEASVRSGGAQGNAQLLTLMDKAKKLNVSRKIVDNAIKRGTGEVSGDSSSPSEEVTYEFMGPKGIAFIIEASTDNKNRTIGLVKNAMSQFRASLSPCLFMFGRKGEIIFEPKTPEETVDDVLEVAIDIGAEDVEEYKDHEEEYNGEKLFRIITDPSEVTQISNKLSEHGYKLKDSTISYIAEIDNQVLIEEDSIPNLQKTILKLDDVPEVTNYYTNIKEDD
ncbi:YebC-like protein [Hyphopichia burtonii NRRL Y-1933]|uniref:YebC-like protein n=1 Tax=Hyphopichia burtonii NRRL Y-1933 TaxID=984485 RepID=A0A1E4RSG9_9ASCO|nr:YebC-like protein [Hyphopichia burtonii NRRL Y-1933]ODV70176.1 YebC-like protein [Hyphopichia burtonii NRRL Y-1933]